MRKNRTLLNSNNQRAIFRIVWCDMIIKQLVFDFWFEGSAEKLKQPFFGEWTIRLSTNKVFLSIENTNLNQLLKIKLKPTYLQHSGPTWWLPTFFLVLFNRFPLNYFRHIFVHIIKKKVKNMHSMIIPNQSTKWVQRTAVRPHALAGNLAK